MGKIRSGLEHAVEVLKQEQGRVLLQHLDMVLDHAGEELQLHVRHQILAMLVLSEVHDELVQERVHHDVLRDVVVLPEDCLEASQNHLRRHLVDLPVAPLALVVLQETTDQCRIHG